MVQPLHPCLIPLELSGVPGGLQSRNPLAFFSRALRFRHFPALQKSYLFCARHLNILQGFPDRSLFRTPLRSLQLQAPPPPLWAIQKSSRTVIAQGLHPAMYPQEIPVKQYRALLPLPRYPENHPMIAALRPAPAAFHYPAAAPPHRVRLCHPLHRPTPEQSLQLRGQRRPRRFVPLPAASGFFPRFLPNRLYRRHLPYHRYVSLVMHDLLPSGHPASAASDTHRYNRLSDPYLYQYKYPPAS